MPRCPLAERLCTRMAWQTEDDGWWGLDAVPLSRVRLVVHVVPDFSDLGRSRGMSVRHLSYIYEVEELREMR